MSKYSVHFQPQFNGPVQIGQTTTIRRIAVRETSIFCHHGVLIEVHSEAPRTSQHYHIEEFKRARNWSPIMPRDAVLPDSECELFHTGSISAPRVKKTKDKINLFSSTYFLGRTSNLSTSFHCVHSTSFHCVY